MKKLILAITFLSFFSLANAQIQKGDIQVGGTVSYSHSTTSGIEVDNFNFSPRAGLFLSDLTSVGIQLGYSNNKYGGITNTAFEVGVYSRFHKLIADNFYLFYQPSLSLSFQEFESNDGTKTESDAINIGFSPGVSYFFSSKFAAEATVGRVYFSRDLTNDTSDYGIGLNFDSISFGFSYYFR
ncbi:outer membrane beta-barrel protein [Roseivirga pacifica]|jgi:hypothetical protein|uniref:outer membrane beta-barrel protein n=1 Tax=Roseivirga pacifica TaxID=1267423 RepID=UPI003BAD430E